MSLKAFDVLLLKVRPRIRSIPSNLVGLFFDEATGRIVVRRQDDSESAVIASDPTVVTGADQITNIISLSQAEYDAITPVSGTLYVIV